MKLVLSAFLVLLVPVLLAVLIAAMISKMFPILGPVLIGNALAWALLSLGDRFPTLQIPITLLCATLLITIIGGLITQVRRK